MTDDMCAVPYRNEEHYINMTEHDAITNVMNEQMIEKRVEENEADSRNYRLIKTVRNMIDIAGFDLIGRIEVMDRKTGRIYR